MDALPLDDRPEVAFAGRSNVGKSSLLNALVNRKGLARASNAPGRTRELNFFTLSDLLYLVDLPGYGYATAPKDVVRTWTRLTRDYLRGRATLKRVFVLIDSRHGVKASDDEIMDALDTAAVSYQLVLTKIDKLKAPQAARRLEETQSRIAKRPAAFPFVRATSSEKREGLADLRADIADLIAR